MREQLYPSRHLLVLAAAVLLAPASGAAQAQGDFTPVTDAMLQDPAPGDWLMWRRTLDGWGYSPLDQIDRGNVGELRMVWSRALTAGNQQGTPLSTAASCTCRTRATSSRPSTPSPATCSGSTAGQAPGRPRGVRRRVAGGGQPQHRHLRQPDHLDQRGRLRLRPRRNHRPAGLGDADPRLPREPGAPDRRPDHRRRQDRLRARLHARGRPGSLRHHGARRADRRRAVAHADDPGPRRAGRRDLGRRALRAAPARGRLDGAQLRPRAEPDLCRHVGDLAGAQVHAGREPTWRTSTTTRRWRSTPTRARSCGTTST